MPPVFSDTIEKENNAIQKEKFPYQTARSSFSGRYEIPIQSTFEKNEVQFQDTQIVDRYQDIQTTISKVQIDNPIKFLEAGPNVPDPTENPYMTNGDIIITTGSVTQTTVATLSQYKTVINTSTTVAAFTETTKYTETFVMDKSTYVLSVSKVIEIIPTFLNIDKSTETSIFSKTYTVGSFVYTSHIETVSYTQYLTYSRSTSDTRFTASISGFCAVGRSTYLVTKTSFTTSTFTLVYTQLSETYTWTSGQTTNYIYTIVSPWSFTNTTVQKGKMVTVLGGTEELRISDCYGIITSVSFVDILVNLTFPSPTEIPKISETNHKEEIITLTKTYTSTITDAPQFDSMACLEKGVISTWTLSPMYTSTFIQNGKDFQLKLTQTNVFLKVLTEIGESDSCYNLTIVKSGTMTDVITTTKIDISTFTETFTNTISTYYEVSKKPSDLVWTSGETKVTKGVLYSTVSMTYRNVLITDDNMQTFVSAYTETIIQTKATEYTTVITYSLSPSDTYIYEPVPKNTTVQTIILTRLKSEESQIRRSSICSNFFLGKTTSISSTIIYTYLDYQTLVDYVNRGSNDITVFELGKTTNTQIISINPIESTLSIEVSTVTTLEGSEVIKPSSSITNYLIKTSIYTATYIDAKTNFDAFEDQCSFKQFTLSRTYSLFPVITNMILDVVTKVSISNKEFTQTTIPTTFFESTYGFTILDSKATYVLADFMHSTMTNTFISAGKDPTEILSVAHIESQTAIGSSISSETIVDFIPIRTPFPTFSEELINPYYTKVELTFTKATPINTYSYTIYQKNTNYSISTLTNIMTVTAMFTETFYNSEKSLTYGYSTMEVLVPTQVSVTVGKETTFLTYHTIITTYYTATHYLSETLTQALTFSSSTFDKPQETKVLSYTLKDTSLCYHSFKVTNPTSAYTYTEIYDTWLWTKFNESVTYTVSKFSDYIYVSISSIDGKDITAYYASYSCTGSTSYYSNTESNSMVSSLSTYTNKDYPNPTDFPTEVPSGDEETKTFIITNTFASNIETYVTTLSPTVCEKEEMTATLINTQTFKETYTLLGKKEIYTYTRDSTIAYTLTHLNANETGCNLYVISKTNTNTQIFTGIEVEVSRNDILTESVTSISVPYVKASAIAASLTLTNTVINLDLGKSSNVTTYTNTDLLTFVQISNTITYTETFTNSPTTTELFGPTTATVLKETSVNQFTTLSAVKSSTVAYTMIITQKSPQDMEIPVAQNPCIQFGTNKVGTNIQTYIETFSEYNLLVTYKNGYANSTSVTNVGTISQIEFTMAAFFSTTTVVNTNTVVKLDSSVVVNPNSTITNSISSTFTLTQVYVNGPTTYTMFTDICLVYGVIMKDTTIMMPTITLTEAITLIDTTVKLVTATDVEFVTIARLEYREGLTLFREIPTRTFSLFTSYTTISSFFKGSEAAISVLALKEMTTVVENAVKTYTLVIGTPPDVDPVFKDSNLIYIIIGVVLGVAVIVTIIIVVWVNIHKRAFTSNFESDSDDDILTNDLLVHKENLKDYLEFSDFIGASPLENSDRPNDV